eukprot:scaffold244763_cov30-Tisochrysis_lutea.AAC.1
MKANDLGTGDSPPLISSAGCRAIVPPTLTARHQSKKQPNLLAVVVVQQILRSRPLFAHDADVC